MADEVVGAVIRRAARLLFLFFSILTRNHNDISTKGVGDQSFVKMEKIIFFRGYLGSDDDSVWPLAEEYTRCLFSLPLIRGWWENCWFCSRTSFRRERGRQAIRKYLDHCGLAGQEWSIHIV